MKIQRILLAAVATGAWMGWAETAMAQATEKTLRPEAVKVMVRKGDLKFTPKPDVICTLMLTEDYGGMQPVGDGTRQGLNHVWLHATVENTGMVEAKDFRTRVILKKGSTTKYDQTHTLTLPAGLMKKFAPVEVAITLPWSKVDIEIVGTINVDEFDLVEEANELNNHCNVTFWNAG